MNNCTSLKQIALLKLAVQLLNNSGLLEDTQESRQVIDKKLKNISKCVQKFTLSKDIIEKTLFIIKSMRMEIYKWASNLKDIERSHLIEMSLKTLCWNHQGIIDQKKSIKLMIKKTELDIVERFVLTCIYCLEDDITIIWDKMSSHDKNKISDLSKTVYSPKAHYLDLVSLWISKLLGRFKNLDLNDFSFKGFEIAIQTNNLAAVHYFWHILSDTWKTEFLEDLNTPAKLSKNLFCYMIKFYTLKVYSADIFYFLFSQMNERQQLNFLKYDVTVDLNNDYSLLQCFLEWPYQKYFLQTINRIWDFLPLECYVDLLKTILLKIALREENYDYHNLMLEFWSLSPDYYKSYLRRKSFSFGVFQVLFDIDSFESSDAAVIICIAENASIQEKKILQFDIHGRDLCHRLIKELKWELVELLIRKCISSEKIMRKFKHDIVISIHDDFGFVNFISQNRLKDLESFINWCLLSEEDGSNNESKLFKDNLYKYRFEVIKKFFRWCLFPQNKEIISETTGESTSKELQLKNKFEVVDSLVSWFFTSKQEHNKLQRHLLDEVKNSFKSKIFENISKYGLKDLQNFITWCCLSEEESCQFKKCLINSIRDSKINIEHLQRFITSCDLPKKR